MENFLRSNQKKRRKRREVHIGTLACLALYDYQRLTDIVRSDL